MALEPGQVIEGPQFREPMRIATITPEGPGRWTLGLVGLHTRRFFPVTLTDTQIATLKILSAGPTFKGNPHALRLGLQAYSLGIAYEFDPYLGLSMSKVDPLPHQLEAVYEFLLKTARVRFLLADDAGAGKTIMAGLLIRELKLRGLVERILIVCPANLTFQWQRELRERFSEKFEIFSGAKLREQYGVNPWNEQKQVITSMDLARMDHILPSLKQSSWNLVIVDEAHRMSASDEENKTQRYRLGELLRDSSEHILLLTATPHRGDPDNFSFFLRLLDEDAYADVKSIQEAMARRHAPFYLRRTKEAMVHFPERQPDGTYKTKPIFTRRVPTTAYFQLDDKELELYKDITRFLKKRAAMAAIKEEADNRARAVGFLVTLFQRRLASSTHALKCTLENRANRLEKKVKKAEELLRDPPLDIPSFEDLEEMDEECREHWEKKLEEISLANNPQEVMEEVAELRRFVERAREVMDCKAEAKLTRLRALLMKEGFFDDKSRQLLIFTEFKDTLDYLLERLQEWGFKVGCIHGSMKPGNRDEPGTRLHAEAVFRSGEIQVLVATEAAGEGINLQCCNIMFNYDIPWNPNRLEQRMGRIHRYGQKKDCYIFNFVAENTVEGHVLETLLKRLQSIRDALEDDAVFNVVGEVLPAAHIDRILRDYYAGRFNEHELEERILRPVNVERFRSICKNALEGLASRQLNLDLLVERRAKAKEKRMVPETLARFLSEAAASSGMTLRPLQTVPYVFDAGPTPPAVKRYEDYGDWKFLTISINYRRITTDRERAKENVEWVTPGHPLFEGLRRHALDTGRPSLMAGSCFYSLTQDRPSRLDIYRARVVDGLGNVVHERLFAAELYEGGDPVIRDPALIGNLTPAETPGTLPPVAMSPEATAFLHEKALDPFLEEVRKGRVAEVERVEAHVELSLTELIAREDEKIGRFTEERDAGVEGAAGRLALAEDKHKVLIARREKRRLELARERQMTLQEVERLTTVLILPHPDRARPEMRNLRVDPEVEAIAMREAIRYEEAAGRKVEDVHERNLGYDLTGIDLNKGELRLIEVKGLSADDGEIILTPNEHRVANDRRDCFWLYVVTGCKGPAPELHAIRDPAAHPWKPVEKVEHYTGSLSDLRGVNP